MTHQNPINGGVSNGNGNSLTTFMAVSQHLYGPENLAPSFFNGETYCYTP